MIQQCYRPPNCYSRETIKHLVSTLVPLFAFSLEKKEKKALRFWLNKYLALPYLPDDPNHFQEFTHFLDSIGLTAEWLPFEAESTQLQEIGLEGVQKPIPDSQEQPKRPKSVREGSRGDSPFRSWLPSVPRGDQSLGALSDGGKHYSI